MTWKRVLPAVALSSILASTSFAQITGHPLEFSVGAGIFNYDVRSQFKDSPALHASIGYRLAAWATIEGDVKYGSTTLETASEPDAKLAYLGLGMRFNLRPADNRVVPFFVPGIGYARSEISGLPDDLALLERGTPSLGAGALFNLMNKQQWYLRLQVTDVMFKERLSYAYNHNLAAVAAIHYVMGGSSKDQDRDRVRDWLDQSPDTPIGATVDALGRPADADGDSVLDGIDTCAATPRGCVVDKRGCPLDADADGVCDGNDSCAATPAGAKVDAKGCPLDTDGDGVYDGLDACENTPQGAKIDEKGCPLDADGDGSPDGIDTCEGTPAGAQVDATGCETAASKLEGELLDTGGIRLSGVSFTPDGAPAPESVASLDAAAEALSKWPELKIQIGVHTDGQGKAAANLKASQARAEGVKTAILAKYPALTADNLVPKGFGDTKALVPNANDAARAINRRVEFTVLNKGALVQAGGKRRLGGR